MLSSGERQVRMNNVFAVIDGPLEPFDSSEVLPEHLKEAVQQA